MRQRLKRQSMGFASLAALAIFTANPASVAAQEAEAAQCELHIWPSEAFTSIGFNMGTLFPGFDEAEVEEQFYQLAGQELQLKALENSDIKGTLGLPATTQVIVHDELEDYKITKKRKERRAPSAAPCYYELHIGFHYLVEDVVWGDRFASYFDFRQYSNTDQWDFRYKGEGANKMTAFPVSEEDNLESVTAEIRVGIEQNFAEYAVKARKKMARKRRK